MRLIKAVGRLQTILEAYPKVQPNSPQVNNIKLPRVELPSFDGTFEGWQSFQDLVLATVDNNKTLSGAQKLQYLKSCVKGDPANIIKSFTVTESHYKEAWSLLTDRYDNRREIIHAIITRIFSHPSLKSESASGLQQLLDVVIESIRSLKVLVRPTEQWDDLIVFIINEKMDLCTRKEWARSHSGTDPPTFDNLQEFLEKHIRGISAGSVSSSSSSSLHGENESSVISAVVSQLIVILLTTRGKGTPVVSIVASHHLVTCVGIIMSTMQEKS